MEAIEVNKDAENVVFTKVRLSAQITKEDSGGYVVYCPELDLCTQGQTLKEARHNIIETVELFIESCMARGVLDKALSKRGLAKFGTKPAKALSKRGFAKFGAKPVRQSKAAVKTTPKYRQISIPAQIPLMA